MGCFASSHEIIYKNLIDKIKRGNAMKTFNFDNMDLKSLKIMDNYIQCQNISVFSAQNNKLNNVPKIFFKNIDKIIKIDFSYNEFTHIDDIIYEKKLLLILNFSHNTIDYISPQINNLNKLKELDLSFNYIVELPDIREMINLEKLDVSNNLIQEFQEFILLIPKLEILNLSKNGINNLVDNNWEKSKIKNLDISFNKLSKLPVNLLKFSNISILNLKGNNIDKSQFLQMDGYLEFENRRKERKDQGFINNLDITFSLCGLD